MPEEERSSAAVRRLRAHSGDDAKRVDREILRARTDLGLVEVALERRTEILRATKDSLEKGDLYTDEQRTAIAAVDLFVEKAQQVLTERSNRMLRRAEWATVAVVVLMIAAAGFVGFVIYQGIHKTPDSLDANVLILRLSQSLSLGAFGLVAVKYLTSLARAFFHESTKLLDRRHAMRFGRLYVHLNASKIGSHAQGAGEAFDVEALSQAFGWNIDSPTAFLDVDPKVVADTIWNKIVDQVGHLPAEAVAAAAASRST